MTKIPNNLSPIPLYMQNWPKNLCLSPAPLYHSKCIFDHNTDQVYRKKMCLIVFDLLWFIDAFNWVQFYLQCALHVHAKLPKKLWLSPAPRYHSKYIFDHNTDPSVQKENAFDSLRFALIYWRLSFKTAGASVSKTLFFVQIWWNWPNSIFMWPECVPVIFNAKSSYSLTDALIIIFV